MRELEQVDGFADVLETMVAEVEQPCAVGQRARQLTGERRHEDLPAVGRRPDARRLVNGHPNDRARHDLDLTDVHAHAHAYGRFRRPLVRGQRALARQCRGHCIGGGRERDEERVALRALFVATEGGERGAQQFTVREEHGRVRRAKLLQQSSRTLDVARQQPDGRRRGGGLGGARSRRDHRSSMACRTDACASEPRGRVT